MAMNRGMFLQICSILVDRWAWELIVESFIARDETQIQNCFLSLQPKMIDYFHSNKHQHPIIFSQGVSHDLIRY